MTVRRDDADHLTSGQVAAMIDRRLRGTERTAVIAHLSSCVECRHDLAEAQLALKAVGADRYSTRRWSIVVAGVAAALVIAVPLALRPPRQDLVDSTTATRAGRVPPVDAVSPIAAIAPADGSELSTPRRLVWRSAGLKASYIVTVQDTSGTMLWSQSLADTAVIIPASVLLGSGNRYFWSVDARLADGGSTNMVAHVFTVR